MVNWQDSRLSITPTFVRFRLRRSNINSVFLQLAFNLKPSTLLHYTEKNTMRVSRSCKPLKHFYSLGNEILQEVSDAKYLCIQIDNKLDWNKHISTVAARGQSKLAFLNRNLKGCPKKLRDTAYIFLVILHD